MGTNQWNEGLEMFNREQTIQYAFLIVLGIWDAQESLPPNLQPWRPLQTAGPISWGNKTCLISVGEDTCSIYWTSLQIERHNCQNNIDFECLGYHLRPIWKQVWVLWERLSNKPWRENLENLENLDNLYEYCVPISVSTHIYNFLMWLCKKVWSVWSWLVTKPPETPQQKKLKRRALFAEAERHG